MIPKAMSHLMDAYRSKSDFSSAITLIIRSKKISERKYEAICKMHSFFCGVGAKSEYPRILTMLLSPIRHN